MSGRATSDDNPPNANLYVAPQEGQNWSNNTSFVYSGTINIPAVSNNSGADYISFLQVIGASRRPCTSMGTRFSTTAATASYTTYSQTANSWLSPGPHSFDFVLYNSGSPRGPTTIMGEGFAWDLNGDYTTNGSLSTTPPNGGS